MKKINTISSLEIYMITTKIDRVIPSKFSNATAKQLATVKMTPQSKNCLIC